MEINLTPRDEWQDAPENDYEDAYAQEFPAAPGGPENGAQGDEDELFDFRPGGSFILDQSGRPTAVWGSGDDVLWSEGEALNIASLQGLGKSTIGGQLALGRAGFPEYADLLGFPIVPGAGRVLYLAMDRPRQIARSMRRMVGEFDRERLDEKLTVWQGPPPRDLAKFPALLARMCDRAGADTVVVDSLKDAAVGLVDDEIGAAWNRARQTALRDGVEVLELHHLRKSPGGKSEDHAPSIDDVYGSTWITSGCGSVVMLTGQPGDLLVRMHHVKQPMGQVGPLTVQHDHEAGRTTVATGVDLVMLARDRGGISAREAAEAIYDTEKPTPNDKAMARRRLDKLERDGLLMVTQDGDKRTNTPRLWGPK